MRPILLLALIAFFVSSCCSLPPLYTEDELPSDPVSYIEILKVENHETHTEANHIWEVWLRFYETTEYPHLIQIITLSDGTVLVEAFRMPNGNMGRCYFDHHSGSDYGARSMLVYPGTVIGADWTPGGFCQVARSEAGDVTTTGPNFNAQYQKDYDTTGYVLNGDRTLGFSWGIDAKADGVDVKTPPEHTLQPK
jgi:hypothetical protein